MDMLLVRGNLHSVLLHKFGFKFEKSHALLDLCLLKFAFLDFILGFCSEGETTRFVLYHENAIVSYVRLEEGVINYESDVGVIMEPALEEKEEPDHGDYVDSQKIHSIQDPLYASLWTYYGFGLSPNGVLGCSLKA